MILRVPFSSAHSLILNLSRSLRVPQAPGLCSEVGAAALGPVPWHVPEEQCPRGQGRDQGGSSPPDMRWRRPWGADDRSVPPGIPGIPVPTPEQEQLIPRPRSSCCSRRAAQPPSPPPSPSPSKEHFLPLLAALIPSFHGINSAFLLSHSQTFSFQLFSHTPSPPVSIQNSSRHTKFRNLGSSRLQTEQRTSC